MNGITRLLKNEYVFAVLNKFYMVFIGLLHSILLARYLGAELKGEVSYIQSIVSTGAVVLTFGIHQAYPYYRKRNNPKEYLNIFMNNVLFLFAVYYLIAIAICVCFGQNYTVLISSSIMPIYAYSTVSGYVLLVEHPNRRNIAISIIGTIEIAYMMFLILFVKKNLFWGISATAIVEVLKCIYFSAALKYRFSVKLIDFRHIKQLFTYGFFPMIALLMTTLNYRVDILMLKLFPTISFAEIGVYSIGINISEKVLLISDSVKEILLSKLAKGKGEKEVAAVMRICFPVSIFAAVGIAIIGKPFIDVLYGKEYVGAYYVTLINMCGTIFMVFFKMISQYNIVNKKQVMNVAMLSISVILNILLNWVLVPVIGINGAAVGSTAGYIASAIVFLIYFSKKSKIKLSELVFLQQDDFLKVKQILMRNHSSLEK